MASCQDLPKWRRPIKVTLFDVGFGPANIEEFIPKWHEIPEEFKDETAVSKRWHDAINDMFFRGIRNIELELQPELCGEVTRGNVIHHIRSILNCWELSHEHKTIGAAYLLSLWCKNIKYEALPLQEE